MPQGASSQGAPSQGYAFDGDQGFLGLNSRDNPINLGKNYVSKSQNFRMDRGVATLRKGTERLTPADFVLTTRKIYTSCTYTDVDGNDYIIFICNDGIYKFSPETESFEGPFIPYPTDEYVDENDEVDAYQAQGPGYVYICRGFAKTTLRWNGAGFVQLPGSSTHNNYPNSRHAIYYGNRHIVQTDSNTFKVSHYLSDSTWTSLDMFSINDGGSDRLVAFAPWTLNEIVVFMRNSIFYANIGVGAVAAGDSATNNNTYVKSLAVDIGCIAKKTVVQAGGGIFFLSDNGVYIAMPQGAGSQGTVANTPEGMRLLTLAEPLSATIQDVTSRVNYAAVSKAVACYFEGRYYLAVPLDDSETNNAVLVYNFILKSWESVDTYPVGFDIRNFHIAKKGNRRRLFVVDQDKGVFLMESLEWDEYDDSIGTPLLDDPLFKLDTAGAELSNAAFKPHAIEGILVTRAYSFDTNLEKRFSSVQIDAMMPLGSDFDVTLITVNPDSITDIKEFYAKEDEDYLLRIPTRKSGYYAQIQINVNSFRPSIRSTTIKGTVVGHNIISRK